MTFTSPLSVPPRRPAGRRAGFTIVEVVMTAFVLALGISTSIIVIQSSFKALDSARNTTLAAQIMQSEMERLRLLPWAPSSSASEENAITTLPASKTLDISTIFPANTVITSRFTVVRTVSGVDVDGDGDTADDTMKRINVTVTWKGLDNLIHTRSTTTHYCQNGLYDFYYTRAGGS